MRRTAWLFPVLAGAVLLAGYGIVPTPSVREPIDSFSEDGQGKKAFYLLASGLLDHVGRSTTSLVPDVNCRNPSNATSVSSY